MDTIIKQAVKDELSSIQRDNTCHNESSSQSNQAEGSQSSNRTVNRLSGLIARIRNRKSEDHSKGKKRKSAVIKEHRIQVRWHHYDKTSGKYLPVRQKNGGGNRFVEYLSSNPPTLEDILNRSSKLYFPGGKNKFAGQLVNLKKGITDSSGEVIVAFPEAGTVSDYLNANGVYPSTTYFCLRTEVDEDNDESGSGPVDSFLDQEAVEDPFPSLFEDDVVNYEPSNAVVIVTCEVCFTTHELGQPCLRCLQNEEYTQSLLADQKFDEVSTGPEAVESDRVVDLDHIRAQRVAYLTGATQNIAAESLDHDSGPGASSDQNLQEIPPTQSEDYKVLKVRRSFIQQDMIRHFKDDSCMGIQLTFTIINDMGKAELGAGEGVTREVFTLFWKHFANAMTVGERERVPFVRHDHFIDEWEAFARILVKGYETISYFPTFISKAFMSYCLFGRDVPAPTILESFMKYLSPSEEELARDYMARNSFPDNVEDEEEFFDFLERFKCRAVVNKENITTIMIEIGQQELMQKPHLMVSTWQPVLQTLKKYPPFQTLSALEVFYEDTKPTTKKVLQLLDANPNSDAERDAFRFLQRYVRGLDNSQLLQFLRFTTASDILISGKVQVTFLRSEGFGRRPIAHTCGPVLELPSTY